MTADVGSVNLMSTIRTLAGAIVAAMVIAFGAAPSAAVAEGLSEELLNGIATRAEFGFRADQALVEAALLDPSFDQSYGVPLTIDEKADLEQRFRVQEELGPLVTFLNKTENSSLFGGIYLDQQRGGEIVVLLTTIDAAVLADLAELVPAEGTLRVRTVTNSLAWSTELLAKVDADLAFLQGQGIEVTSTWYSPQDARVMIGVHGLDASESKLISVQYAGTVGAVEEAPFHPTACTSRTNCGSPIKGGLNVKPTGGGGCTAAFNARADGIFAEYVVTAGHCVAPFLGVNWNHNGVVLGTGYNHSWETDSRADMGIITDSEPLARNQVFAAGISDIRGMTSAASDASQVVGASVYRSAWASNSYTLGTITKANYSPTFAGSVSRLTHQWEWSKGSINGDSGSTMMLNLRLYGVLAGSNGVRSHYGTIDGMSYELGIRPCLNSSCS